MLHHSQFFGKEGLDIPKEYIEGTIHCKPGAAVALLNRLYVLLTQKEWVDSLSYAGLWLHVCGFIV